MGDVAMRDNYGGEIMTIGEATERVSDLNGMRVRCIPFDEMGTVYNVYVNRDRRIAQIWVNMDSGGARCFRPYHLESEGGVKLLGDDGKLTTEIDS
jgi:hypothetical protein